MACGSDVADDADRCPSCGAEQQEKLFHEGSDVRLEVDRLGELMPERDLSLPAGRWGRASEHPSRRSSMKMVMRALRNPNPSSSSLQAQLRAAANRHRPQRPSRIASRSLHLGWRVSKKSRCAHWSRQRPKFERRIRP
jgi:hypothetical protein